MGLLQWKDNKCINLRGDWRAFTRVDGRTWRYVATNQQEGANEGGALFTCDGFNDAETAQRACEFALIGCGVLDLSPTNRPGDGWIVTTRDDEDVICSGCGMEWHKAAGREWRVMRLTVYKERFQCESEMWCGTCPTEADAVRWGMAIARALAQLEVAP